MNDNELKKRLRMSIYLDNRELSVLDDIRYLLSLNGRKMRALLDFTDIIDGLVYYLYFRLNTGPEETRTKFMRKFARGFGAEFSEEDDAEKALKNPDRYFYTRFDGYTSKVVILKESQKKIIDRIVEIVNNGIGTLVKQAYSDIIKRIISIILMEKKLIIEFFDLIYFGNLYGLLPVTILKLYLPDSQRLTDLEHSELKKIEFIRYGSPMISELKKIQDKLKDIPLKEQASELDKELSLARDSLWSFVSDFNYADSFYGYALSKYYLVNGYKSLISLIMDINTNNVLFNAFSRPTPSEEATLYLYFFALYRYRLDNLNGEAIKQFQVDNKKMDGMGKVAAILTSSNPFDRPSDLI